MVKENEKIKDKKFEIKDSKKKKVNKDSKKKITTFKAEMNKIKWPNKKEMLKYSVATVVFVIFFAIFFYIIELLMALLKSLV